MLLQHIRARSGNGVSVQSLDAVASELIDESLRRIPRGHLFTTRKGTPHNEDYLAKALKGEPWNTTNRLMRYACDTKMWGDNSLTYAERKRVLADMNHSVHVSLNHYNKPELNKRARGEDP